MHPGSNSVGHRRGRVPFVLTSGVDVDVGVVPNYCCRLGSRGAHWYEFGTEGPANSVSDFGGPRTAYNDPDRTNWRGQWSWRPASGQHARESWKRHCTRYECVADSWRHVHGPVGPAFTEPPGPVERVNDPDAGRRGQRDGVTLFLRQDSVDRTPASQLLNDGVVRPLVTLVPERAARPTVSGLAECNENLPSDTCHYTCHLMVSLARTT